MKKLFLLLISISIGIVCLAQTDSLKVVKSTNDSLIKITNEWLEQIELDLSLKQRFKLYPTENMYTFLLLDTKTGMIDKCSGI